MEKISPEELAEFREIFNLVDRDGGGSISKLELAELLETLGIDADVEEIDRMIAEIDQGKHGWNDTLLCVQAIADLCDNFRWQRYY